ncbi:MAG: phospholipid carrier-dependent glycosyltransferase [Lentisphaeria bacterium]|nr:phospholipid carrier-dependent glycosyltransferase [Lentisphaeria bacterium]
MKLKFNIPAAFIIFFVLYMLLIGVRPLYSPDEARYVEIPREMIADHDFVTPRLNGARYFEKPVMGYWLIAGAVRVFGENAFAGRFMPALSTGLAALIVLFLAMKMTGKKEIGLYAAGVYLLMPLVFIVGTSCTLDAMFSLFVTATIAAFYCAVEGYVAKKRLNCVLWLLATGAAAGCAFLTKGFLAFALPVMAVLPWMVWEKRWKAIFTLPWLPFVVALAVIAPWGILIHRAQPDFWRYFVMEEHFARFFGGAEAEHPHGSFYFFVTLLWGAAEWFLLAPAIGYGIVKIDTTGEKRSWFRFLLCWFAGPFLFLSASSGKLPTYILPCFPALSIMISAALFRYFEERPDGKCKLFNVPVLVFTVAGAIAGAAALVAVHYVLPKYFDIRVYNKNETWKIFILFNALVLSLLALFAAFSEKKPSRKLSYFLSAVVPVFVASYFTLPQAINDARSMDAFLEECRDEITPDTIIIAHGSNLHAICLAYHRNDLYVIFPGELTYGLTCKEAEEKDKIRNQGVTRVQELLDRNPDRKVVMIFPADRYYSHSTRFSVPFPPALAIKKSIPDDPEDKKANGQVLVRFR